MKEFRKILLSTNSRKMLLGLYYTPVDGAAAVLLVDKRPSPSVSRGERENHDETKRYVHLHRHYIY